MAIYRAVGQNTYKFVTETNFTLSQDLTVPNRAYALPILKYNNTSSSDPGDKYLLFSPGYSISYSGTSISLGMDYEREDEDTIDSAVEGRGFLYSCVVDGETYYGTKSARFISFIDYNLNGKIYYYKKAIYKIIKYQASSSTIVVEEYTLSSGSKTTYDNGSYNYINFLVLLIPKQADDIILAIETVFPEE